MTRFRVWLDQPPEGAHPTGMDARVRTLYRRGLANFAPFNERGATLPVDIVYPDRSPARLAYVEPFSLPGGRPRLRLQPDDLNRDPAILAHELAHALHFSLMPTQVRAQLAGRYLWWLVSRVVTGADPTHAPTRRTAPLVAWVEAFGLFAERWDHHARSVRSTTADAFAASQRRFVATEVAHWTSALASAGYGAGATDPPIDDVEGAVYLNEICRRAAETTLAAAVGDYLASAADGVLSASDFRAWRAGTRAGAR